MMQIKTENLSPRDAGQAVVRLALEGGAWASIPEIFTEQINILLRARIDASIKRVKIERDSETELVSGAVTSHVSQMEEAAQTLVGMTEYVIAALTALLRERHEQQLAAMQQESGAP